MGQSKRCSVMKRSNTSLEALCDVAELQWTNLLLNSPPSTSPYRSAACHTDFLRSPWKLGPCQIAEGEPESRSLPDVFLATDSHLKCPESEKLAHKMAAGQDGCYSPGITTVVTDPASQESNVSVSVTCQGTANGKKWSFQLHNINSRISDEDIAEITESVRSAINSTLNVGTSEQALTKNCPARQTKLAYHHDDTTMSVVSRDSGLPLDPEHVSMPSSSSYHSAGVAKHGTPGQYVMLQALTNEPASDSPSPTAQAPTAENRTPEDDDAAVDPASPPAPRNPRPKGFVCYHCKHTNRLTASYAPPAARRTADARRHESGKAPTTFKNRKGLTLATLSQDTVEDYLKYRFASVSDDEKADARSLTFSEYFRDEKCGSGDGARDAQQSRRNGRNHQSRHRGHRRSPQGDPTAEKPADETSQTL